MYLGVRCVIAKSIARIHKGNLINHGIVPMLFENNEDYDKLELLDELEIDNFPEQIKSRKVTVRDKTKGLSFNCKLEISDAEMETILDGGQLRHLKQQLVDRGIIKE
jgi:aconitate hydratase